MNARIRNLIIVCLSFILLIGEWGCAHKAAPPSPLSESVQQQLSHIGVVIRSTGEKKTIETPRTGRLSNLGRGAGRGSLLGAVGILCGPGAVVCIPVLAGVGAIGGSIVGAAGSESESMWRDAESTFGTALADMNFDEILLGKV